MNLATLALGFAFRRNAGSADPVAAKKKRLASILMFLASAAFFLAFAISAFDSEGAR